MKSNLPQIFLEKKPWNEVSDPIWLGSSIILHRNIHPFLFPDMIKETEAKHTISMMEKHLSPLLDAPKMFSEETLLPSDKELLFEHFILTEGYEKFDARKAFLLSQKGDVLGLLNVEDHLHIHFLSTAESLEDLFKKSSYIERKLNELLPFAFSKRFGYLTSDPKLAGIGLSIQAFLHLPTLITLKKFPEAVDTIDSGISVRGLGKENSYLGNLVLLENKYKLGISEENALEIVQNSANMLMQLEKDCRKTLTLPELNNLKDHIARAYGLLAHGYFLEIQECLQAISLLDLAKELHLLETSDLFSFKNLFFQIRRAHLHLNSEKEHLSKEEILQMRANLLRKSLENSRLILF